MHEVPASDGSNSEAEDVSAPPQAQPPSSPSPALWAPASYLLACPCGSASGPTARNSSVSRPRLLVVMYRRRCARKRQCVVNDSTDEVETWDEVMGFQSKGRAPLVHSYPARPWPPRWSAYPLSNPRAFMAGRGRYFEPWLVGRTKRRAPCTVRRWYDDISHLEHVGGVPDDMAQGFLVRVSDSTTESGFCLLTGARAAIDLTHARIGYN
ncbi:hypothetical protein IMZ48_30895 [Candidatus Bathyarchaeota archaeon]|nr:hypothetical protein [Candidatus Bathyarchaeota archaeon]